MGEAFTKGEGPDDRREVVARGPVQSLVSPLMRRSSSTLEPGGSLVIEYYRTMSRYRWTILFAALLGLLAGFLIHLTSLPVYEARTSVDVQTLNGDFMNMRTVAPTNDGAATSADSEVQTQIKLMQSETLLEQTAARMDREPHPKAIERNDLLSQWKRSLHISRSENLPYKDLINFAQQNVKVKPLGLTRLIEVTCDSWDADFSAKFCNTLTDEFSNEELKERELEGQKTSVWLTRQAEDVRLKAEDLEKQLERAVGGNGLILSQETNTVGEERLREIQQELVKAKADRMEKEAQLAIANSSAVDTVPGVNNRPAYLSYQQKLADLRAQVAQLVPPLTEENPKVKHLRSQIREVEAGLDAEWNADMVTMKNEYAAAQHREALLSSTYQATEASVSRDLGKAAQVSLLRHEVDSEQLLYETLQQRAKEAGFASAMKASTIHLVDAARTPKIPISPRRRSSEAAGLVLGSFIGIGVAFFKDRNFEVLRMPGDSQRFLHLNELGVIPSADVGRTRGIARHKKQTLSLAVPATSNVLPQSNALALARWGDHFSIMAEAYRNATLSILLAEISTRRSRSYVVASPNASDGKTSVTCNLGVALSRSKLRVLLVDGDMRRPALHTALRVPNDFGLRDILRSDTPLEGNSAVQLCKTTDFPNLWVLPSGSGREEAVELLHSPRIHDLMVYLAKAFDVVLIDTPPMLHMADARLFAGKVDGVILIFRAGVTMREEAVHAVELFERDRAHVVGTILNDFNPSREGRGGYYRSYLRYKEDLSPIEEVKAS